MSCFITGCAGFIGSHLTDRLLQEGHAVTGYDNFSTGRKEFLSQALKHPKFRLIRGDTLNQKALARAMRGSKVVFHLAANADVRFGLEHTRLDLEQNTLATYNVLEAMRRNGLRRILFTSTGSIYGEPKKFPTPEDAPFPVQTSLYGASKLAAEALISAYGSGFGFHWTVLRLVSALGERYSHGHIVDFMRQLKNHPDRLDVLGDGKQKKSYLYISDLIEAVHCAWRAPVESCRLNMGTDEYCTVKQSIGWICSTLGLKPRIKYSGGARGWIGDSPFIFLDCARLRALKWKPARTIQEGVVRTVRYLELNPQLLAAPR